MSDYTIEDAKRDLHRISSRYTPSSNQNSTQRKVNDLIAIANTFLAFIEQQAAEIERLRETADQRARDAFLMLLDEDNEKRRLADLMRDRDVIRDQRDASEADRDHYKAIAEWLAERLGSDYIGVPDADGREMVGDYWLYAASEAVKP